MILDQDFTRGSTRLYCRRDCHRGHSYGLCPHDRNNEDNCNTHNDDLAYVPTYDDAYSPCEFGFFDHEGKCYMVDQLHDFCGGYVSDPIETPVHDYVPPASLDRSYKNRGSRAPYQSYSRSCTRGIPYEMCLEGVTMRNSPGIDSKKHPKGHPIMMYDPYGRLVRLEFESVQNSATLETRLVVVMVKPGPRGYCLGRNQPIPRKYGARFDNLDGFRNGNLGLYEHVDVKKLRHQDRLTTNRLNHLGEDGVGPFFCPLTGKMETWVVADRRAYFDTMDDDGLTKRNYSDPFEETFSNFAHWIENRQMCPPEDLGPEYFAKDFGTVKIGLDHSASPGSVCIVNNKSTGLTHVTFTDVTCPAYSIIGPLYTHVFVDRLDVVKDMRVLMEKMKGFGRDAVINCIRKARQQKRSKWTDFDECFNVDGSWNHVVGPVRVFLESGGSLADKDALFLVLDGASTEQKEKLYEMARERNYLKKDDFYMNTRKFPPRQS